MECSCNQLGIDSLIHLKYHDAMGIVTGISEYFTQTRKMKEDIKLIIEKISPDFILTFGPDGDTGHSDHRNIGNIVTEILLREKWVEKFPLYYLAWNKEQSSQVGGLNYMDEKYLNIAITFTEAEEKQAQEALRCHRSQLTEKEIQEWIDYDAKDKKNTLYFRKFEVAKGLKTSF